MNSSGDAADGPTASVKVTQLTNIKPAWVAPSALTGKAFAGSCCSVGLAGIFDVESPAPAGEGNVLWGSFKARKCSVRRCDHRCRAATAALPTVMVVDPGVVTGSEDVGILAVEAGAPCVYWVLGGADPALRDLQQQLAATRDELGRLRQTQEQITQTLAELAEQNTRLVAAVELLRKRTRLLMGAVLVLAVALGALGFNAA